MKTNENFCRLTSRVQLPLEDDLGVSLCPTHFHFYFRLLLLSTDLQCGCYSKDSWISHMRPDSLFSTFNISDTKMHVTLSDTLAFCRSFVDGGFPFLVARKRVVCLKIRDVLDLMKYRYWFSLPQGYVTTHPFHSYPATKCPSPKTHMNWSYFNLFSYMELYVI